MKKPGSALLRSKISDPHLQINHEDTCPAAALRPGSRPVRRRPRIQCERTDGLLFQSLPEENSFRENPKLHENGREMHQIWSHFSDGEEPVPLCGSKLDLGSERHEGSGRKGSLNLF
ncbi:hypothetical protein WMY93_014840 [Mugilogobius chulae]|uniref:Uncharacterized protein n=1 Tax=Mugilogobius chulae TaxID=88201 RepID=A0AAW0NVQ1_9GOBI